MSAGHGKQLSVVVTVKVRMPAWRSFDTLPAMPPFFFFFFFFSYSIVLPLSLDLPPLPPLSPSRFFYFAPTAQWVSGPLTAHVFCLNIYIYISNSRVASKLIQQARSRGKKCIVKENHKTNPEGFIYIDRAFFSFFLL